MKWFEIFFHIEILKIMEKSGVCEIKSARTCVSQLYFPTDVKLTICFLSLKWSTDNNDLVYKENIQENELNGHI